MTIHGYAMYMSIIFTKSLLHMTKYYWYY